jgi:hypothetical protein
MRGWGREPEPPAENGSPGTGRTRRLGSGGGAAIGGEAALRLTPGAGEGFDLILMNSIDSTDEEMEIAGEPRRGGGSRGWVGISGGGAGRREDDAAGGVRNLAATGLGVEWVSRGPDRDGPASALA